MGKLKTRFRQIAIVSMGITMVSFLGLTGYLASYYFSSEEIIERREIQLEEMFTDANEEACSLGRYMQDNKKDGSDFLAYCDDRTAEEVVAWGGAFLKNFNR